MENAPLLVASDFLRTAAELPKDTKSKLVKALWLLSRDTRHPSLQTKKLDVGSPGVFECRVDQSIRLIYDISQGALRCLHVGQHDEAINYARIANRRPLGVQIDDIVIAEVEKEPEDVAQFEPLSLDALARKLDVPVAS